MLKDSFCSSPWIHARIRYDGSFRACRWSQDKSKNYNILDHSIEDFYSSENMRSLRSSLLSGEKPNICRECYYQDDFGKISGRQKQLLKSAISINDFECSMRASPHYDYFEYSYKNQGNSQLGIADLQIDLGNICNSACIMCNPEASSRLENDYQKLNVIEPDLFDKPDRYVSWTRDPVVLERFSKEIAQMERLKYLHLLGGETLYDPAFYDIARSLISSGASKNIILGTTTNGTIYIPELEEIIKKFKGFHLGISIETVTDLNDYVRWPGKIDQILSNIDKFFQLRQDSDLFLTLRITPNIFTIYELDQLIQYMIDNNVPAESCNILTRPSCLRIELMPDDIRQETLNKLEAVIVKNQLVKTGNVNTRANSRIQDSIADLAISYRDFVKSYTIPKDSEKERKNLIRYLKAFEKIRNNRIIDYAPRFQDFLRHHGY